MSISPTSPTSSTSPIVRLQSLQSHWPTLDPFLFCVHHHDAYPRGNAELGPQASLAGRNLGQDFAGKDGWSMYHGHAVAGFPAHPHRGFETVSIVRQGWIDHADSLGASARFGPGDVQWLTAGQGIVHSEMFPLLQRHAANPLELFQIWLNLPAQNKMVPAHFRMLWGTQIPEHQPLAHGHPSGNSSGTTVRCIAGTLSGPGALPPPPNSWAAQPESDVAILTIQMQAQGRWRLPAAQTARTRRQLYFFQGSTLTIAGQTVQAGHAIELAADQAVDLHNGDSQAELLLLQGRPLGEPVVQHGPFVMNSQADIVQAFHDYRANGFGGWPWPDNAPVHAPEAGRFARHADGRTESAPSPRSPP